MRLSLQVMDEDLVDIKHSWHKCERCKIGTLAHRHVLWEITPNGAPADTVSIVMIGEGPGQSEDTLGRPFIGPAGRLLRDTVSAVNTQKIAHAYTNLVACRPISPEGKNREPDMQEIENCEPRLQAFLNTVRPAVVLTLGLVATEYTKYMFKSGYYRYARHMWAKHPSYIMRDGGEESKKYPDWKNSIREAFNRAALYGDVSENTRRTM